MGGKTAPPEMAATMREPPILVCRTETAETKSEDRGEAGGFPAED